MKVKVRLAPWQAFWLELRSFIASVPVWVTVWLVPGPKSVFEATAGIEKLSVVELALVSNDSHVVCSVPLLLQADPVQVNWLPCTRGLPTV